MRKPMDDMAKPFPYVFPQMPPRFRRCRAFAKAVFLMQWGCFAVFCLCTMVLSVLLIALGGDMEGSAVTDRHPFLGFLVPIAAVSLLLFFLAVPIGFAPRLFWRCPCCGRPFPYYVPTRGDKLREKECLMAIRGLHIKYVKRKFCPLVIPSACPGCGCRFFEVDGDFHTGR